MTNLRDIFLAKIFWQSWNRAVQKSHCFEAHNLMLMLLLVLALGSAAWAQTERVLYSFCSQSGCPDGGNPNSGVVFDEIGNMYGTAYDGGAHGYGTVYQLTPEGVQTTLYSFCTLTNCADGQYPTAKLIRDRMGNLYGMTDLGGMGLQCCGTAFKLTPQGDETAYSFSGKHGELPEGGLTFGQHGKIYGTTSSGGAIRYAGTVFEFTPERQETVVYNFCTKAPGCADGTMPLAGVIFDEEGNLYGTTSSGGAYGFGTIFMIAPDGQETVLYSFCSLQPCADGDEPEARLVRDKEGNLYGTTLYGGVPTGNCNNEYGCGTVFKLTPAGEETVLHSFCAQGDCIDGENPYSGLVLDASGNLYGMTTTGGRQGSQCPIGCGVIFRVTPEERFSIVYSFCANTNCIDGASPDSDLTFDQAGNLYGTTTHGGSYGWGTVFKLAP